MATGKPSLPGSLVGQASRLPTGRVVTDVQARRPLHKASRPPVWCTGDECTTKIRDALWGRRLACRAVGREIQYQHSEGGMKTWRH
jgi:hypothetical protein